MTTIRDTLLQLKNQFSDKTKYNDAVILLANTLKCSKEKIIAFDETKISQTEIDLFAEKISRLQAGEPLAYIIGAKEFWSLKLNVNSDCLIPRPDTECLVQWVLDNTKNTAKLDILDLGTGSGAIACALAHEQKNWAILATDISRSALEVAKNNAQQLNLDNITFKNTSFFDGLNHDSFDIIISNPPYIAPGDKHLPELSFEPQQALVANDSGYADLNYIIENAQKIMRKNAIIILEHGYDQADLLLDRLKENNYTNATSHYDYAGNARFVTAYKG
jgi:release factor glutamine methyltransferase